MTKTTTKDEKLTISLQQIMEAVRLILGKAEENGLTQITLGHDWYWQLDPDDAFDMVQPSPNVMVGDLYEDGEIIRDISILKDGLIGLHLTQVAALLSFIGSTYPSLYPVPRNKAISSQD